MTDQMSGKAQEAQVPGFDRGLFSVFSAFVSQLWKQKLLKKGEVSGILLLVSEI